MMKKTILFLFTLVIITSCHNRHSFTLNGVINGAKNKVVYLNRVNVNTLVPVDSSRISGSGKFSFRIKANEPDFYQIGLSDKDFITILAEPGEKIKLTFKSSNFYDGYTVLGSEGSEKVRMLDYQLNNTKMKLDSLRTLYQSESKNPDFNSKAPALEAEYTRLVKDLRKKTIEFIITNTKSLASIKALYQRLDDNTYVLYDPRDLQYLKIVSDSLLRYYPNSKDVQALAADTKKELDQMYARKIESLALSQPAKTLDPNLQDISGRRVALSSLKGKYVLLTFWSVDSRDCIAENLLLKGLYKKYHSKGFEIYQINLDENEDVWKNEVRFDELPWISTREDDPRNPENAMLYNVRSLPANFLYDKDGNIIATNLHGNSLQIKLDQLFNN